MALSLQKGQKISLEKASTNTLTRVVMGLGWDARSRKETRKVGGFLGFGSREEVHEVKQSIDLDASCVLFDAHGKNTDTVWFRQLTSKCGGIVHTGDNRTGDGEGDDEQIIVDLTKVDPAAKHLIFVVNSFSGESFAQIENAVCRLVDASNDAEIARFSLTGGGNHTAQLMCRISREGGSWSMTALGQACSGRTFVELLPTMQPHVV